ncbi:MAG TPA: hypothetical protein VHC69_29525 [Polyangiaceae bacterium]|nr:hypothetical protein [Polyangiaceae bacterium]
MPPPRHGPSASRRGAGLGREVGTLRADGAEVGGGAGAAVSEGDGSGGVDPTPRRR